MEPMAVTVDLVIIAILFVIAVMLTRDRSRAWLLALASELAGRYGRPEHTPEWELEHAELWLMARRKQLTEDLHRIEQLLLHDATMSATRQLGNRLAREQLLVSLARIPDVLPGRDRYTRVRAAAVRDGRALARPGPTRGERGGAGRQRLAALTGATRDPSGEAPHVPDAQGSPRAIADERPGLAELLSSLTAEQRAAPSLCSDWSVLEVVAHLVVPLQVSRPVVRLTPCWVREEFRPREHPAGSATARERPYDDLIDTSGGGRIAVHSARCGVRKPSAGPTYSSTAWTSAAPGTRPTRWPRRALADVADLPDHRRRPGVWWCRVWWTG